MADAVFTPVTPADGTFSAAGSAAWAAGMTGPIVEANITLTDNTTNDFSTTKHGFVPKGTNVGSFLKDDGTWASPAGSATLDGITAATGDQAGISNGDFSVRWNWAKTSNTENSLMLSESAASTNGTSSSGVPNQILLRLATVAASTMSPLRVDSRGSHVFSVSPTTAQIFATNGSTAAPVYGFAGSTGSGLYWDTGNIGAPALSVAGVWKFGVDSNRAYVPSGSGSTPGLNDVTHQNTGLQWPGSNVLTVVNGTDGEWARFLTRAFQVSRGSADAVGYALNFRKSRGTVASPTVITTGDDLATISGFGYVGATGTYVEAAQIKFDSDGTIANTTSGVGGIIRLSTSIVGTVGPIERVTIDNNATAAETSILVSINGGAPVRVSKGANDSGGAGYAVLRIPN